MQLYVIHTGSMVTPLLQIQGAQRVQTSGSFYPFRFILCLFSITHVRHDLSSTKFLSFTDKHRATPVQDTAQRRHRRRRAAETRSKDSFQIKTLRKPFLLSLVDTHPLVSWYNQGGGWRFGMWPRQSFARTWTLGAYF